MNETENRNRTITMKLNESTAIEAARKKPKPDQNVIEWNNRPAIQPASEQHHKSFN